MKRFGVILTWVLAVVLVIAVAVTAAYDSRTLKPITPETFPTTATTTAQLCVNVNTATAEELQQISGIGEKLAGRIVMYREAHGGFRTVEDLLDIEGIGEKSLNQWRPYLCV